MFFGPSSLSAVKLILGLPWNLEILDGMYWQLSEMCKLTTLYLPILISVIIINMT